MDGDIFGSFVHAVDMYFSLNSIINKQTKHKFASLLLIEDAKIGMTQGILPLMLPNEP